MTWRFSPGCDCGCLSDCAVCCSPAPPEVLYVTFTSVSNCNCLTSGQTFTLYYVGSCKWTSSLDGSCPPGDGSSLCTTDQGVPICCQVVFLECLGGGTWRLTVAASYSFDFNCAHNLPVGHNDVSTTYTLTCSPLLISFTFSVAGDAIQSACSMTGTVTQ